MDPDATLETLREFYNLAQDEQLTENDAYDMVEFFDALDNWIIGGGFLPREWRR